MEKTNIKSSSNGISKWASAFAADLKSAIDSVSFRIHTIDGLQKIMYTLNFVGDDGWSDRMTLWDTHLPVQEDIEKLRNAKQIVDVLLFRGVKMKRNDAGELVQDLDKDGKVQYGQLKIDQVVLDDGTRLSLSGARDVPGITATDEDED